MMMYELRDANDKLIKEITYKELVEKLNNHEASQIKENKRIVGCRLYEPIKPIEIKQEEVIKGNVEVAEDDDLPNTRKIIIRTIIGIPLLLSFFFILIFTLTFIEEICFILTGLLMFYMASFFKAMARVVRYCAIREVYKGKK